MAVPKFFEFFNYFLEAVEDVFIGNAQASSTRFWKSMGLVALREEF